MTDEFNHDKWVETMVATGQMVPEGEDTYTPGQDGEAVVQPDFADESVENGGGEGNARAVEESLAGGEVEVKYLGHGAYEAEGVEVRRNGQTVSVDEAKAATLTGLQDDEGNVLFERV